MTSYKDRAYINKALESYGKGIKIKRGVLVSALIVFCMLTPMTNFLLLFVGRIKEINLR